VGERSSFKVPRRRVAVELGLSGQAARRVEIFLGEHRHHAWHRQDVLELLEGERQFLPCTVPGGGVTLVNRDHIVWLAMAASEDRSPSDEETPDLDLLYDHCHHVSLRLGVGPAIEGALLHSAPSDHARLADHVNQPGVFLSVHAGDRVILVRKSAVIEIVESDPGDEQPEENAG
jgi:hypothetical protein